MKRLRATPVALALSFALAAGLGADPFADAVVDYTAGPNAGFGQGFFPGNVLGAPEGGDTAGEPQMSEQHLLSLGHGGSITLEFTDNVAHNGPGPDLLIFENVLLSEGTTDPFIEIATVEVSADGVTWVEFPFDIIPADDPPVPTAPKVWTEANYPMGFAGLTPVLSNSGNGVDPTDPAVAGGDAFDLDDVGLAFCRFVRLTDGGLTGTASQRIDGDGDILEDDGDFGPLATGINAGFDLDAIAALHDEGTTSVGGWGIYR